MVESEGDVKDGYLILRTRVLFLILVEISKGGKSPQISEEQTKKEDEEQQLLSADWAY